MIADPDDLKYVSEAELASVREQIQEDMIAYCEGALPLDYKESQSVTDDLCQIVVNNFKKL